MNDSSLLLWYCVFHPHVVLYETSFFIENNLSIKIFFKSTMKSLHEISRGATLSVEILHEDQYDVKLIRELPS